MLLRMNRHLNEMSLKLKSVYQMDCHSKWNVIQNGMSPKMECHSKGNFTKMDCHSKWNITRNKMSLKLESHSNLNVTKIGMSFK